MKELTWKSAGGLKETYPLCYKWKEKIYKCEKYPQYCSNFDRANKVFKYKDPNYDKEKNEDDCLWGVYVCQKSTSDAKKLSEFINSKNI